MEQINTGLFFIVGQTLAHSVLGAGQPLKTFIAPVVHAQTILGLLTSKQGSYRLDESGEAAARMKAALSMVQEKHAAEPDSVLAPAELSAFNNAWTSFQQALLLELGRAPIFYVTPKGVYDTRRMISRASAVHDSYKDRLPWDAIRDTDEAGRCLAFALPTAAGFHIARATEAVIKAYMDAFGCAPLKESQRNWGKYIDGLRKAGADERVANHLEQIKNLHRNPLVHPEVTLEMFEAQALWAICMSAIQAMVADMETKRENPSPEISDMLPPEQGNES